MLAFVHCLVHRAALEAEVKRQETPEGVSSHIWHVRANSIIHSSNTIPPQHEQAYCPLIRRLVKSCLSLVAP